MTSRNGPGLGIQGPAKVSGENAILGGETRGREGIGPDAPPDALPGAGHGPAMFTLALTTTAPEIAQQTAPEIAPEIAQEIARAHAWLEQVAAELGLAPATVFALQLCVEEAVSNIAITARRQRPCRSPFLLAPAG